MTDTVVNRRAFLATLPSIVLAGCATRLGLADRVEIVRKTIRLYPRDEDEPIDAAVRRFDPDEGASSDEPHEAIADDIDPEGPLVVSDSLAERLEAEFESVEYRIRACETDAAGDCRGTTFVRGDFNEVEAGDVVDLVPRSSGSGLVEVYEPRDRRE